MSAVISPLGLVSAPVAEHFDISITTATAAFTYLTTGVLVGTTIAVFIFDILRLKQVVLGGVILICLSIYAIYAIDSFAVFSAALTVIGAACGIELSAGTLLNNVVVGNTAQLSSGGVSAGPAVARRFNNVFGNAPDNWGGADPTGVDGNTARCH